ncbi:hypothetical protein SAMD00019534_006460, partial [Acytostelium subglobosum LB1]|uniref:hypothetical protein n=1 Tax=Acytostelium subglobosum LB1 TaxID=1410327 RepID=UPI000644A25E
MNFDIYNFVDYNQFFKNLLSKSMPAGEYNAVGTIVSSSPQQQQQQGQQVQQGQQGQQGQQQRDNKSPSVIRAPSSPSSLSSSIDSEFPNQQQLPQVVNEKKEYCYGLGQRTPEVPFIFTKLTNQTTNCFECLEYDTPIIKNEEGNVISAFDYIFTDFFRENTLKLTNGSFKCQLDSCRFNNEKDTIDHMRTEHKSQILHMVALLAEDDGTSYMGNFFSKLMYSDALYSIQPAAIRPDSSEALLEYCSVVAPTLPPIKTDEKDKAKRKTKKSKKAKLKPKVPLPSNFPRDELSEFTRSLFGQSKVPINDNITRTQLKKVNEALAANKGETEEARMKKEQAIFNETIAKIRNVQQQPEKEKEDAASIKQQQLEKERLEKEKEDENAQLVDELADLIIDEVVEELTTNIVKKISTDEKKKRAKELEKEREREQRERDREQRERDREQKERDRENEDLRKEKEEKEHQLKLERQAFEETLQTAISDLAEDFLDEIIGDEVVSLISQTYHEHLAWKEQQHRQQQLQLAKEKKTKLNVKSSTPPPPQPTPPTLSDVPAPISQQHAIARQPTPEISVSAPITLPPAGASYAQ